MTRFDDFDLDLTENKAKNINGLKSITSQHSFCTPNCTTGFLCPPKTFLTCGCL